MPLTIVYPVAVGAPCGWGCRVRVHTGIALVDFESAKVTLRRIGGPTNADVYAAGQGTFSASSGQADVIIGLDNSPGASGPYLPGLAGPSALAQGAAIDCTVTHFDASGVQVEQADFLAQFVWDSISQLGYLVASLAMSSGHDPMLDEILAAVRRTYT